MLKLLLKKQFLEMFKSYFYDAKKNRMRSKGAIIAYFAFFIIIMAGMMGGIFTMLSLSLCGSLNEAGMGWMYFLLMGGVAILLGAFGSVFNTYSTLYLAKDNDQLLSLPIPVRTIITSRLLNVYLMGTLYSSVVLLPTLIVYWCTAGFTPARFVCGILLYAIITVIVLLLSCLLGWAVARISLKLKNKSFITVLLALAFLGAYYFFYFRANELIRDLIANAAVYGEKIKGAAYILYLFGRIGEGSFAAAALFTGITAALTVGVWFLLSKTFLSIATSSGASVKARYVEKPLRQSSVSMAFLKKEFSRFTSSPSYMLNCGLGILFLPALGVMLLILGDRLLPALEDVFQAVPGAPAVLVCTFLCMLPSMIDTAAPSVSLEGKSIWIPQSLPIDPRVALRAKAGVNLILSGVPMLFAVICAAIVLPVSPALKITACLLPLVFSAFTAVFHMFLGVKMPIMNWTSEVIPIKQGGAVAIAIFADWGMAIAMGGLFLLFGDKISAPLYLGLWTAVFAAAAFILFRWLDTKGSQVFAELS